MKFKNHEIVEDSHHFWLLVVCTIRRFVWLAWFSSKNNNKTLYLIFTTHLSEGIFETPFRNCPSVWVCQVGNLHHQKVASHHRVGLDSCQKAQYYYRLFFLGSIAQSFTQISHELFCQFISWTNCVNSCKFVDYGWAIKFQFMAFMEKKLWQSYRY